MAFDLLVRDRLLEQALADGGGRLAELLESYCEDVVAAFRGSPEAAGLPADHGGPGDWADHFTRNAHERLGVVLSEVRRRHLDEIVGEVFPRQISLPDRAEAETVIPELTAFWTFLAREYALPHGDEVLKKLAELEPGYVERMLDPANFGPAKSFVMAGIAAGYDMTNEAEATRYMEEVNAGLGTRQAGSPFLASGPPPEGGGRVPRVKTKGQRKRKRQLAKASRKANRRR